MGSTADESSGGSGSVGAAMSIFGESIVRKPEKNKRRVLAHEDLSSDIKQLAKSEMDKQDELKAEAELSTARTMAKELERQIEHTNAKARSKRSELKAARASSRRTKRLDAAGTQVSNAKYIKLMQELDRVKRELRKLKQEVKSAREAKAKTERDVEASTSETRSNLHVVDDMKRQVDEAYEKHVQVELALVEAVRERCDNMEDTEKKIRGLQSDVGSAKDHGSQLAAINPDVEVLQAEMALVRATEKNHVKNDYVKKQEAQDDASLQVAEAELTSARKELESIKEEGFQLLTSMDRTRNEIKRVAEELSRLKEQEKKVDGQVQPLNGKLLKVKSRLEVVTAADERAEVIISNLTAALQQLHREIAAAKKEKELTELENQCVRTETENITAEIAATEERIRRSVRELEEVSAAEAAEMAKLKAVVESTMRARATVLSQRSGNVTISRFDYEYLTGRPELARAVADKKVAAAEAWVEALRAGQKEMAMRAEAMEREIGEVRAREAEAGPEVGRWVDCHKTVGQELCERQNDEGESSGLQRAYPPRRTVRESRVSVTSRSTKMRRASSSSVARNTRSPSFTVTKKRRRMMPNFLKLIMVGRG